MGVLTTARGACHLPPDKSGTAVTMQIVLIFGTWFGVYCPLASLMKIPHFHVSGNGWTFGVAIWGVVSG